MSANAFPFSYFMTQAEPGTLHISNVQYYHAGEYYCTAQNRAGQHQRRTILTVTGMLTPAE